MIPTADLRLSNVNFNVCNGDIKKKELNYSSYHTMYVSACI